MALKNLKKTVDIYYYYMYTYRVNFMREWLSGRALPCQGKCREFESRLPLQYLRPFKVFFYTHAVSDICR